MFTLFLPGLNWPQPEELPSLNTPALNRLLRFGRFQAAPAAPADFCFAHLGVRLNHLFAEPYAFASPLHQQLGLHSAQLQSSGLAISPEEAEVLCHGLNAFCGEDGWQFAPLSPELWSIRLPRPAPDSFSDWQTTAAESQTPIEHSALYLDNLQQAAELGNPHAYAHTLQQWDEQFFAPLWHALQRKHLPAARLLTDGEHGGSLEIRARSGWAFWKPKRRFSGRLDGISK